MRRRAGIHHAIDGSGQPRSIQCQRHRAGLARESGEANRDARLARRDHRQKLVLLGFRRAVHEGQRRHHGCSGKRDGRGGVTKPLRRDSRIQYAKSGAAESFRNDQPVQTEFRQTVP